MKPHERNCSLTLDEISIQAKTEYDISSKSIMGHVTLPEHNGIATHTNSCCLDWLYAGSRLSHSISQVNIYT